MNYLSKWQSELLAVLRVVTGLLFLEHGTQKFFDFPVVEGAPLFNLAPLSLIWFAGLMELIGAPLIILGLFTRPVAFLLSGEMAVAYWMAHGNTSLYPILNRGEAAVMYCFVFLYLSAAGPGMWSLDALMSKAKGSATTSA